MDKIGKVSSIQFELFGQSITLDPIMFLMTYVVIAFLVISSFLATRRLKQVPGNVQNIFEVIYEFIEDVTLGTLGNKDGKNFIPFIFTILFFSVGGQLDWYFATHYHLFWISNCNGTPIIYRQCR